MTDLNRLAAELGEYGSDPNDNGTHADPDATPEDDSEEAPAP